MAIKLYKSYQWLHRRFVLDKMSIEDIATEAGVTEMTIRRELKKARLIN